MEAEQRSHSVLHPQLLLPLLLLHRPLLQLAVGKSLRHRQRASHLVGWLATIYVLILADIDCCDV